MKGKEGNSAEDELRLNLPFGVEDYMRQLAKKVAEKQGEICKLEFAEFCDCSDAKKQEMVQIYPHEQFACGPSGHASLEMQS